MKTTKQILTLARKRGWPDKSLAALTEVSEETIRRARLGEPGKRGRPREIAWRDMWPIYQKVVVEGVMFNPGQVA